VDEAVAGRVLLFAALIFATACNTNATGRSQAELSATAFGAMTAPAGSKVVLEGYVPSRWTIEGAECAILTRRYASTDAAAFLATFRARAIAAGSLDRPALLPDRIYFYEDMQPGYSPGARADVEGTHVFVDFHKTGYANWWPAGVDPQEWPFIIVMRIQDAYVGDGGGCR
jgi:hypothetical protein